MPNEDMVADLPNGVTIIVAHRGQPVPTDPTVIRETLGILPHQIVPRSQSRAAHVDRTGPPSAAELEAARAVLARHAAAQTSEATPADDDTRTAAQRQADSAAKRDARNTAKTPPAPVTGT